MHAKKFFHVSAKKFTKMSKYFSKRTKIITIIEDILAFAGKSFFTCVIKFFKFDLFLFYLFLSSFQNCYAFLLTLANYDKISYNFDQNLR